MPEEDEGSTLKTLTSAIRMLEFIKNERGAGLAEVANNFNIAKSTAHGYLSTLEDEGFLVLEEGVYFLGLRLYHFGERAKARKPLYSLSVPRVDELANQLGEGVNFLVPENGRIFVVYDNVDAIDDPFFKSGRQFYMHNTAAGKAVLAELEDQHIEEIIKRWGLSKNTERTITEKENLFREIDTIRGQGYATIDGELVSGYRAIGVTVNYPEKKGVFGALGVGGPDYRISDKRFHKEIPNTLKKSSEKFEKEISRQLQP